MDKRHTMDNLHLHRASIFQTGHPFSKYLGSITIVNEWLNYENLVLEVIYVASIFPQCRPPGRSYLLQEDFVILPKKASIDIGRYAKGGASSKEQDGVDDIADLPI
ncbi:hypothetical protein CEXT_695191 [Caerostris extrusa]|uniref:Uncharacterized protein n=1 Tax=Caerostris extrusa TaxID=172846 RepID=A0AAV4S320_CAEEX|nr:hypothetical protein CEXT_695191 [Caerostris extrusa]